MFRQAKAILKAIFAAALFAVPAQAAFEETATIDAAVATYLADQGLSVEARPVDSRLKLQSCTQTLAIEPQDMRRSLVVRCPDADGWRIFVTLQDAAPALVQATAARPLIVTMKTSLPRGAVISARDLELAPAPRAMNSSYLRAPESAIGHKLLRSATAGTPLTLAMLERPPKVRRGDRVVLRASGAGFSVQVEGLAKEDGAEGDMITATNLSSGEKTAGRINSDGTLLISF